MIKSDQTVNSVLNLALKCLHQEDNAGYQSQKAHDYVNASKPQTEKCNQSFEDQPDRQQNHAKIS